MRGRRVLVTILAIAVVIATGLWLGQRSGDQPPRDAVAAAEAELGVPLESARVDVGDVVLHVVQAGPAEGPPVLLLHGFPEFWYAWKDVIPPLVAAGFRVIVPDQRGYNASDKPRDVDAYRVGRLSGDAAALLSTLGHAEACVAGHDWGGGVAWDLALRHPERVRRMVVIDTPHPRARLPEDEQAEETISWYRVVFQVPWLPEWVARLADWRLVTDMLRNTSAPGAFPEEKLDFYRSAWDRDGAFGAMVNWYRASFRQGASDRVTERVRKPTLLLLAPDDAFIPAALTRASVDLVQEGRLEELPRGTHWVIQEEPELVAERIAAFCGEGG